MPIIIVTVLGKMCHALVDTGACKSLISKQTAQTILGTNFMKLVKNCSALPLRDVNNKPLVTLGQIDLCVQINQEKFHHSFIIYNHRRFWNPFLGGASITFPPVICSHLSS